MSSIELQPHDPTVDNHDDENGNGLVSDMSRGTKRQRTSGADEDDDDDEKGGKERRKIDIKFIQDKSRRHITFSKRKAGIMKKAYELSVLTGTQVLLLVVSETGLVYTFTTPKLQPLVTKSEGKNLIQACLNAPEPPTPAESGLDNDNSVDPTQDDSHHSRVNQGSGLNPQGIPGYPPMTTEQALQYQSYLTNQNPRGQQAPPSGGPGSYLPTSAGHLPPGHGQ